MRVVDPTSSDTKDVAVYTQVQDLVPTTATSAEIDASMLFRSAEDEVVRLIPSIQLPAGRTHRNRETILIALVYIAVANLLEGGGKTAGKRDAISQTTGVVKTESIGPVTRTFETGAAAVAQAATQQLSVGDRIAWFREQARRILSEAVDADVSVGSAIGTVNIKDTF